jgi:hypothetical protein
LVIKPILQAGLKDKLDGVKMQMHKYQYAIFFTKNDDRTTLLDMIHLLEIYGVHRRTQFRVLVIVFRSNDICDPIW